MPVLTTPTVTALNAGVDTSGGVNRGRLYLEFVLDNAPLGTAFTVEWTLHGGSSWSTSGVLVAGGKVNITALSLSTNYDVRLKASCAGYTDSPYWTASKSTGAAPASSSDISAHGSVAVVNVGTPGSVLVTWAPTSVRYTRTTVTFSTSGEADRVFSTGSLENALTCAGLTVGLTYAVTVKAVAVIASGTIQGLPAVASVGIYLAAPFWDGPSELYFEVGKFAAVSWQLYALEPVMLNQSALSAPGVALSTPDALSYLSSGTSTVFVAGTPVEQGIVKGAVTGVTVNTVTNMTTVVSKDVTFGITGPQCVGWLNVEASRVDVQVNLRTRAVQSFAHPGAGGVGADLRFTLGEPRRLFILARDAAGRVVTPSLAAIWFFVRRKDRRDGAPLIETRVLSVTTVVINGNTVPVLDVVPDSPMMRMFFARMNANPSAEPGANALECEGELVLTPTAGGAITSQPFTVTIGQDLGA